MYLLFGYIPIPTLVNIHVTFTSTPLHVPHESTEEGKDRELIQSSITPDTGHHMGKSQKHKKTQHTREPRGQPFPSRGSQGCKEQKRQHNKDEYET